MSCAITAGTASRTISGKIRPWSKRAVTDVLLRFIDNEETFLSPALLQGIWHENKEP